MRAAVPLLVLILLSGCAGSDVGGPAPPEPTGTPEVHEAWSSCAAAGAPGDGGHSNEATLLPRLGTDFAAAAVVVCRRMPEKRADGGTDLVDIEGRATDKAGVAAVVDAVRLPNGPGIPKGAACTSELPFVPWFVLVDAAGRWVRPGVPVDGCHKPRTEVLTAVETLALQRISTTPVREIESSGAAAAGCAQDWADMVWVTGGSKAEPPPATRIDPLVAAPEVRVCLYRVPKEEQGGGKPAGRFERGAILSSERRTVLRTAIDAAAAAPACATPANRFAVFRSTDGAGGSVYAELDGCRRILVDQLTGGSWLGTADAALIASLENV
jgi:hypothetical protein